MAIFDFTGPDKKVYTIPMPDGTSKEAAFAELQKQLKQGSYVANSSVPADPGILNAMQSADNGIYDLGGRATDLMMKTGVSPETAAKVGFGTNVGLQSALAGVGVAGKAAAPAMDWTAKWLMKSAVKPSVDELRNGTAAVAIDRMFEHGINATKGGMDKLRALIDPLDAEVRKAIANSPETINKWEVGKRLLDTWDKFKNQVNPNADLDAIKRAWNEFRNSPLVKGKMDIPVKTAQDIKQGTYARLGEKSYGEVGTASVEAQKTLARGIREEMASKIPGLSDTLKNESELIKTLDIVEKSALTEMRKNPAGLSLLTRNPSFMAAYLADKSAAFKSIVARMIHASQDAFPMASGLGTTGGISVLNEMVRQSEDEKIPRIGRYGTNVQGATSPFNKRRSLLQPQE